MKLFLMFAAMMAGTLTIASLSSAKPEYSKKEGKACTTCHIKAGAKDLNDAGKHYKEHGTLDGYKEKK